MSDLKFLSEPFLDSDQAAAILRIHPKTLQRLARLGNVTGYRIGKLWRFHASDLEAGISVCLRTRLQPRTGLRFKYHSCPQLTGGNPCLFGHDFNTAVCGYGSANGVPTCGSFVITRPTRKASG